MSWIAETEEEKAQLHCLEIQTLPRELRPDAASAITFGFFAQAVFAPDLAAADEKALSFFRRGLMDSFHGHYIEALHDYLFMLELLFADGRFRKVEVLARYKRSGKWSGASAEPTDDQSVGSPQTAAVRQRSAPPYA